MGGPKATRALLFLPLGLLLLVVGFGGGYLAAQSGPPLLHRGATPTPTAKSLSQILDEALRSVVTVETKDLDGSGEASGFVLAGRDTVVTNAHAVASAYDIKVVDDRGTSRAARVVGLDNDNDVAELIVTGLDRTPLGVATKPAGRGAAVWVLGNPLGENPNTNIPGSVSGLDVTQAVAGRTYRHLYAISAGGAPGNSGSAVITETGQVIGIWTIGYNRRVAANAPVLGWAIPVETFAPEALQWAKAREVLPLGPAPVTKEPREMNLHQEDVPTGYLLDSSSGELFLTDPGAPPNHRAVFRASSRTPVGQITGFVEVLELGTSARQVVDDLKDGWKGAGYKDSGAPASLGPDAHLLTLTQEDGTTQARVIWRERNVEAQVVVSGLSGDAATQLALSLAATIESHIKKTEA